MHIAPNHLLNFSYFYSSLHLIVTYIAWVYTCVLNSTEQRCTEPNETKSPAEGVDSHYPRCNKVYSL